MTKKILLTLLALLCMRSFGQAQQTPLTPRVEVALSYNAESNQENGSLWMHGGSAEFEGRFWRGLGAVARLSGSHIGNMNQSGVGLDLITASFGPRYTLPLGHGGKASKAMSLYGELLAGEANAFNSVFPGSSDAADHANSFALTTGGGLNLKMHKRLSLRLVEAHWLRTTLPNNQNDLQNSLQLGAGLVWQIR